MWMTIVMLCGNMYANSCLVITSKNIDDYYATKEECFKVAIERANFAMATPQILMFYLKEHKEILLLLRRWQVIVIM